MTTPIPALGGEGKQAVRDFWNQASCGEDLYLSALDFAGFDAHMLKRYELEPYIADFAKFSSSRGKHVLEIGVGLGADHQQFAQAGAHLSGIDLTERAVLRTTERFRLNSLSLTCESPMQSIYRSSTTHLMWSTLGGSFTIAPTHPQPFGRFIAFCAKVGLLA
jgi:hypothetical protein